MPPDMTASDAFSKVISAAVRESATQFFETSYNLTFVDKISAEVGAEPAGIMAAISFVGNPAWAFALVASNSAAVMISKAFAGFDIPFDSPDMVDVFGEVVNVIAGDISARLDRKGLKAQMSLPTVIRGEHVDLHVPSGVSTTRLSFTGPKGSCWFKLIEARDTAHMGRKPGS